jgi:hypothetical protein
VHTIAHLVAYHLVSRLPSGDVPGAMREPARFVRQGLPTSYASLFLSHHVRSVAHFIASMRALPCDGAC